MRYITKNNNAFTGLAATVLAAAGVVGGCVTTDKPTEKSAVVQEAVVEQPVETEVAPITLTAEVAPATPTATVATGSASPTLTATAGLDDYNKEASPIETKTDGTESDIGDKLHKNHVPRTPEWETQLTEIKDTLTSHIDEKSDYGKFFAGLRDLQAHPELEGATETANVLSGLYDAKLEGAVNKYDANATRLGLAQVLLPHAISGASDVKSSTDGTSILVRFLRSGEKGQALLRFNEDGTPFERKSVDITTSKEVSYVEADWHDSATEFDGETFPLGEDVTRKGAHAYISGGEYQAAGVTKTASLIGRLFVSNGGQEVTATKELTEILKSEGVDVKKDAKVRLVTGSLTSIAEGENIPKAYAADAEHAQYLNAVQTPDGQVYITGEGLLKKAKDGAALKTAVDSDNFAAMRTLYTGDNVATVDKRVESYANSAEGRDMTLYLLMTGNVDGKLATRGVKNSQNTSGAQIPFGEAYNVLSQTEEGKKAALELLAELQPGRKHVNDPNKIHELDSVAARLPYDAVKTMLESGKVVGTDGNTLDLEGHMPKADITKVTHYAQLVGAKK